MNFFKQLLTSKTIQGIASMVGGMVSLYVSIKYPQYSSDLKDVGILLGGLGAAHAVNGRINASGPITGNKP